ncbi:hypothetical protein [Bacillus mycoides]|uniref:hypothetical protein n=1 Tax=Bacillus mycoides TaxID=1405 RepID=UPI0024BD67E2|nr:hypothetical protein [Bacillus mycoides]
MILTDELQMYKDFCEENFSESYFTKNFKLKIIEDIYKCLEAIDIYKETSEISDSETATKFLLDLEYLLINLLYSFPANNYFYYSSVIRSISEICMRVCYSSQFKEAQYEKINTMGFRELDEALKKCYSISMVVGENYAKLNQNFGSYSKIIHNQGAKPRLELLEDCIKNNQLDNNKIKNDLKVISMFCLITLPTIFGINDTRLSTAQKMRLLALK